jgi:integrase
MDKIDEYFDKALITKKGTTTVFRSHIARYFKVINKDMETYFDTKQPYEEHIRAYWKFLQSRAPKTRQVAISALKGFLKRFDKDTMKLDIWDDIQARMRGNNIPVSEEHVPDLDELKQILQYGDIRCKTTIMVALSSGMRISEVVQLLPTDIHLDEKPTRINVRAEIAKNGRRRTTFISNEATELLEEWLRIRDEYIKKSMASFNFKNRAYLKDRVDNRLFPYSSNRIRDSFNHACDMAGFTRKTPLKGDTERHRKRRHLHYHNLRKFFRTYFGNADLAEHLMGHTGYLSEYRQYNDKQLAQEYLKHMNNVTVFTRESEDIKKVNEQLKDVTQENARMKQEIHELRNLISELGNKKLERLQEIEKQSK